MTTRLLDPDEALRRLETRLGPLHAQLRLGIEREHEAQAFGQGLSFLHLENLPLMNAVNLSTERSTCGPPEVHFLRKIVIARVRRLALAIGASA